jgi:sarcosine oxidase subunit gamma
MTARGPVVTADLLAGAVSPLAPWADALAALTVDVQVRELPFLGQLSLRLDPQGPAAAAVAGVLGRALPQPSRATRVGNVRALWLGPDEWLVLTPPGAATALATDLHAALAEARGAVVDVSAQRTTLALSGPRAADVLAKGCSLDLDAGVRPPGTCVTTLLAQTGVTLVVDADGFLVLVRPSFADYLARWLLDASVEID